MMGVVGELLANLSDGKKIAFLGVGSPLRADDSVGLYIVEELEQRMMGDSAKEYLFYLGESAPENFSGMLRNEAPSHVVIIDAAEMGKSPGAFTLIEPDQIDGISFSTHTLPLKILIDYLTKTIACQTVVVGVQPKLLEFGYPMTAEVKKAANQFITDFLENL
jgi:hydrogenase 3 maturation protease